jgi:hypothetical protein
MDMLKNTETAKGTEMTTRYAWIDIMGIDYCEIEAVEKDEHLYVDTETRERMALAWEGAEILPEPDQSEHTAYIWSLPVFDGLVDVTDLYGGWDTAQTMKVDA